jgi:hypothetical protein
MSFVARSPSVLSTMMCLAACAAVAAVVVGATTEARADNMAAARAQYQRGVAAQERGRFKEAAIAYEAAYLLAPDTALLWNAAHAHRLAGNKRRALLLFRSYARQSTDNRNEAQPFINELKAAIEAEVKARAALAAAAPATTTTTATAPTTAATTTATATTTTATATTTTASSMAPAPPTASAATPSPAAAPAANTNTHANANSNSNSNSTANAASAPAPSEPSITPVAPSYVPAAPQPTPAAVALVPASTDAAVASAAPATTPRKRTPRWVWGVLGFVAGAATVSIACGIALQPPTYPSPAIGTIVLR